MSVFVKATEAMLRVDKPVCVFESLLCHLTCELQGP